jgi:hypothetical protein
LQHLGLHKRALPDLFAECARVVGRTLGCHYAELGGDGKNVERCVAELRAETRRFWSKIEKLRRSFRAKADRNGGTVTGEFVLFLNYS